VKHIGGATIVMLAVAVGATGEAQVPEIVCQLGITGGAYNPALDGPSTPRASGISTDVYRALCPGGCGLVELRRNPTAGNALTRVIPGVGSRVSYSPAFFELLDSRFGTGAVYGVLAHELGHHIDLNQPRPTWADSSWSRELRADAWAGCAIARAGISPASLEGAVSAIMAFPSQSHPGADLRIPAIRTGFTQCGGTQFPTLQESNSPSPSQPVCVEEMVECTHLAHPGGDVGRCMHLAHVMDQTPCGHVCFGPYGPAPCHAFDTVPCSHALHPMGDVSTCGHLAHPGGDVRRHCD
jgi:hypothetical protein